MRSLLVTAILALWVIVLLLVGGRFLALLLGANADSELVARLYRHSDFWVKPFFDIFGLSNESVAGGGTFEPASLIAFVVYFAIGILIARVIGGTFFTRLRGI